MSKIEVTLSRFISLILRHKPEAVGITLDANGWCDIDALIEGINGAGKPMDRALLEKIVKEDNKQRYIIDHNANKIRANQGHSIAIDLELKTHQPPSTLYHGTVPRFLASILEKGLIKGQRQHVHLSDNRSTALSVGKRRGEAVILEVDAVRMFKDGYVFYRSENGVWLTDFVPSQYIKSGFHDVNV